MSVQAGLRSPSLQPLPFFLEQGAECHWEDRVECQLFLAKIYRSFPAAAELASFRNLPCPSPRLAHSLLSLSVKRRKLASEVHRALD